MDMGFQSEYAFTLPRGYVDAAGRVHRQGLMRLATALDEIDLLADPRVAANDAYISILLLCRVIRRLGDLPAVTADVVGGLFVSDLLYLEDLYLRINQAEPLVIGVVCPHCSGRWQVQVGPVGDVG
jgi:hypothetical protein